MVHFYLQCFKTFLLGLQGCLEIYLNVHAWEEGLEVAAYLYQHTVFLASYFTAGLVGIFFLNNVIPVLYRMCTTIYCTSKSNVLKMMSVCPLVIIVFL